MLTSRLQGKKAKEQQKAQKKAAAAAAAAQSKKKESKLSPSVSAPALEELVSDDSLVPRFVTLCVRFIELEGLTAEGIYRVNGNRAQVELLFDKYREGQYIHWVSELLTHECLNIYEYTYTVRLLNAYFYELSAIDVAVDDVVVYRYVQSCRCGMRGVVDEHVDIVAHDIPVNAVATALKQFFSDLSQPLVPTQYYDELIEVAGQ